MGRMAITTEQTANNETTELNELVERYGKNKEQLDTIKKLTDADNKEIKKLMQDSDLKEFASDSYKAKYVISTKNTVNEDKLIDVLKTYKISDVIKTKEYVDFDALESYIYNHNISSELASAIDRCNTPIETIQLRISKRK